MPQRNLYAQDHRDPGNNDIISVLDRLIDGMDLGLGLGPDLGPHSRTLHLFMHSNLLRAFYWGHGGDQVFFSRCRNP